MIKTTHEWQEHILEWVISSDGEQFGLGWSCEKDEPVTVYYKTKDEAVAAAGRSGYEIFYVGQVFEPVLGGLNGYLIYEDFMEKLYEETSDDYFELDSDQQAILGKVAMHAVLNHLRLVDLWPPPVFAVGNVFGFPGDVEIGRL